ncbi:MAG: hypothetical protein ACYDEP_12030 [Acidimicrobiales bacterium]
MISGQITRANQSRSAAISYVDKKDFFILDYCGNLEFFSLNPATAEGRLGETLSTKLFTTRLDLIAELDRSKVSGGGDEESGQLRTETASLLHGVVASMNVDNFVVRPKREHVERFAKPEAWTVLGQYDLHELATEVSPLPSDVEAEDEEAKRFDLLMLNLQLAVLRHESRFTKLQDKVIAIAGMLQHPLSEVARSERMGPDSPEIAPLLTDSVTNISRLLCSEFTHCHSVL